MPQLCRRGSWSLSRWSRDPPTCCSHPCSGRSGGGTGAPATPAGSTTPPPADPALQQHIGLYQQQHQQAQQHHRLQTQPCNSIGLYQQLLNSTTACRPSPATAYRVISTAAARGFIYTTVQQHRSYQPHYSTALYSVNCTAQYCRRPSHGHILVCSHYTATPDLQLQQQLHISTVLPSPRTRPAAQSQSVMVLILIMFSNTRLATATTTAHFYCSTMNQTQHYCTRHEIKICTDSAAQSWSWSCSASAIPHHLNPVMLCGNMAIVMQHNSTTRYAQQQHLSRIMNHCH